MPNIFPGSHLFPENSHFQIFPLLFDKFDHFLKKFLSFFRDFQEKNHSHSADMGREILYFLNLTGLLLFKN